MVSRTLRCVRFAFPVVWALFFSALPVAAQVAPEGGSFLEQKSYGHPDLYIFNYHKAIDQLAPELKTSLGTDLTTLRAQKGLYDVRAGRWGTLILSRPLIPGSGNSLSWSALGVTAVPSGTESIKGATWQAFVQYLTRSLPELGISPAELDTPTITVHEGGHLVHISVRRAYNGIPVRENRLTATINSGNLLLQGSRNWGDLTISTVPSVSKVAASAVVAAHVAPQQIAGLAEPRLEIVTLAQGSDLEQVVAGKGLRYRLAWVINPSFKDDHGTWEALVDAQSGELLQFADQNQYISRKVVGGVFPVSNDQGLLPPIAGGGPNPAAIPGDGTEQPGWPMPFADILVNGNSTTFTNSSGVLSCAEGTIETKLDGRYVRMSDECGAISMSAASGDLDLGVSGGTDCDVPGGSSPGNTHSSRTGFFEVNRIKEMARGWLPDNVWLQGQLTSNMNINQACNAFWNGSSINFFRSSARCANTGEIAGVFDHEWGHGMDAFDANPGIALPGEATADMYSLVRLNDSCIGRGFFKNEFCSGQGDRCTQCTGVREVNWAKRVSNLPHNIAWIQRPVASPGVPGVIPSGGCVGAVIGPPPPIPGVNSGPCGQSTHCEGSVVSEILWDLLHRDLAGPPFNLDENTRLNLVARLHYLGANVFLWFTCNPPSGGCEADGGYLNYLASDDDDGNLSNGTPHMTAIFNAFNRHQMACPTPAAVNGGCATAPAAAPTVTATPIFNGAKLNWNAVTNATTYWVFRTDSLAGHGCNFGKERVAITAGTQFIDKDLMNGRTYYYTVEAVGTNGSCRSAASICASVVPGGTGNADTVDMRVVPGSATLAALSGDADPFLDNCENARISFTVQNTGDLLLSNVRIVAVTPISHPEVVITSNFPSLVTPFLSACSSTAGTASFTLQARGLSFDDTVQFRVDLTSDEMALLGIVRSDIIEISDVESDFTAQTTRTFGFETQGNLEGWAVVNGTFTQTAGGSPSSPVRHLASSVAEDGACDEIRSPLIRLSATSTLSLFNQFSIEPSQDNVVFYDRANVGIFDTTDGLRTTVEPSGGRLYTASGPNSICVTEGEKGWAGPGPGFLQSTWSAAALQSASFAGRVVQLDVAYGTDSLLALSGFQFDQVTLTNFDLQTPDVQSDVCGAVPNVPLAQALVVDGAGNGVLEAGETATLTPSWKNVGTTPLPLTGTLSSFTGPAGPTYNIFSSSANYGTIQPDATAACSTCYAVSIAAVSRPAVHWDTTALESLSVFTEKPWTVHVGESFTDVATSFAFYRDIETLVHNYVTLGCGDGTQFCKNDPTTRVAMAVFIARAELGSDGAVPLTGTVGANSYNCTAGGNSLFTDVPPTNQFCKHIHYIASQNITQGCTATTYCPTQSVTRIQMAIFLARAIAGSDAAVPTAYSNPANGRSYDLPNNSRAFTDLVGNAFEKQANYIWALGITDGCTGTTYCPSLVLTRGQMAKFLVGTYDLLLYKP